MNEYTKMIACRCSSKLAIHPPGRECDARQVHYKSLQSTMRSPSYAYMLDKSIAILANWQYFELQKIVELVPSSVGWYASSFSSRTTARGRSGMLSIASLRLDLSPTVLTTSALDGDPISVFVRAGERGHQTIPFWNKLYKPVLVLQTLLDAKEWGRVLMTQDLAFSFVKVESLSLCPLFCPQRFTEHQFRSRASSIQGFQTLDKSSILLPRISVMLWRIPVIYCEAFHKSL
jgi:hypothetical protein